MSPFLNIDDLIAKITLYIPRHWIYHGYVFPFIFTYALHIYLWLFVYGVSLYFEAGLISLAVIGIIQILTCLSCLWSVHIKCKLTCKKAKNIFSAVVAEVVPTPNNGCSELVNLKKEVDTQGNIITVWFEFQKIKYVLDVSEKKKFEALNFPVNKIFKEYLNWKGFSDDSQINSVKKMYGQNSMNMILPSFSELFLERATAPFFIFQVFCVALWCLEDYWYYSLLTFFMLVMFECTLVQQQLRNMCEIRRMGNKPYSLQVYRNRKWRLLSSEQLIPGDIVSVGRTTEYVIPCDLLLLRGSCIVDESMLTGESIPQSKEPLEGIEDDRCLDIEQDGHLHVLYGGTRIVQHTGPLKTTEGLKAPDNGCIAYVLRTGFNTSQGQLLRTILFGVKKVTANNLETFVFILFLLIFAIMAAGYVWQCGIQDERRNRYKLLLECSLILTSVVPPELPIELSLAVNQSLISLSKLAIFCTEPFRIPFAGKIDICCFDKTGTLTSDDLIIEGIAGLSEPGELLPPDKLPLHTQHVLAACHSLIQMEDGLMGDSMEKAMLKAIGWNLTKSDVVIPQKSNHQPLKICQRFHFSSALKRMSVIACVSEGISSVNLQYIVLVKGAPETLNAMYSQIPDEFETEYRNLTSRGARVLALGWKKLGPLSHQQLQELNRESLESNIEFVGFAVFSCPLKSNSKSAVKELLNSSHEVNIITGDNPLTACHVAKELEIRRNFSTLILINDGKKASEEWNWCNTDNSVKLPMTLSVVELTKYDLCLTGEGWNYLLAYHSSLLQNILPYIRIFARVTPKQKEQIILQLRSLGYSVLMCGDGTNDVGALRHAHVGVAILSHTTVSKSDINSSGTSDIKIENHIKINRKMLGKVSSKPQMAAATAHLQKMLHELEQETTQIVKLGDASIAAPFTSKLSSPQSVCHVIKQGRCTLVTTLQMFKILALNALILAYCQSVLYIDGVRFGDVQATSQGILMAVCFLFVSRSKPLKRLSHQRPLANIFNPYTLLTVLFQFAVHFMSLIYLVKRASSMITSPLPAPDQPFEPNLLNSTVFIVFLSLQLATFIINYRGHPFMESMWENRPFFYSLLGSGVGILLLILELMPSLNDQLQLVPFPKELQVLLLIILTSDMLLALLIDRLLLHFIGEGKLHLCELKNRKQVHK